MKKQRSQIAKTILKKDIVGELILSNKTYAKAIRIKTTWYWYKYRQICKWKKMSTDCQFIVNKVSKMIQ